jgi:ketosteroid isomerase-like protein
MNRILFALCWVASAAALAGTAPMDSGSPADVLQLRNIEVTFHTAGSVLPNKDLGLMMSLYSDDAVLTDTAHGNKVYQGKDQVLTYWRDVGAPFRPDNHWIGYTPAFRMHAHAKGDTGTLYFECLWMDADHNVIGAHSFSDMTLARVDGHWLVKTIKVGKVEKL